MGWIDTSVESRGWTTYLFFLNRGLSPVEAAAFTGNFLVESYWTLDPQNPLVNQGGARGIAQWLSTGRWQTFLNWAQPKGIDTESLQGQLDFVWHELTTDYAPVLTQLSPYRDFAAPITTTAINKAADIVARYYEGALTPAGGIQAGDRREYEARFVAYELWRGR